MQAPHERLHQTLEINSKSTKLNEMTNLTGWLTAQVLELANDSHFRPQRRQNCQTFMPSVTYESEGVKHLSILARGPSTDAPDNRTASQSANQEEPLTLAGRLPS